MLNSAIQVSGLSCCCSDSLLFAKHTESPVGVLCCVAAGLRGRWKGAPVRAQVYGDDSCQRQLGDAVLDAFRT